MERMVQTNPDARCLHAISRYKGTDPFYYSEVKGFVRYQMKLNKLVMFGWVVSERRGSERVLVYQMTWEAYQRVTRLFAADHEEEVPVQEEHRTSTPFFRENRIARIIQGIWEQEPQDSLEMVAGW